ALPTLDSPKPGEPTPGGPGPPREGARSFGPRLEWLAPLPLEAEEMAVGGDDEGVPLRCRVVVRVPAEAGVAGRPELQGGALRRVLAVGQDVVEHDVGRRRPAPAVERVPVPADLARVDDELL